jgi:hypothetical protein
MERTIYQTRPRHGYGVGEQKRPAGFFQAGRFEFSETKLFRITACRASRVRWRPDPSKEGVRQQALKYPPVPLGQFFPGSS